MFKQNYTQPEVETTELRSEGSVCAGSFAGAGLEHFLEDGEFDW